MYPDLKAKVVVLTGAAGNLGQAVTAYFDQAGSRLALVDRSRDSLLKRFGEDADQKWLLLEADITDPAPVNAMVALVVERYGRIDALVNIAGGFVGGKNIYETTLEDWEFMLNLNAKSVFLVSGAVAKVMVEKGLGGCIISVGAKPGLQGTKGVSAYSASKSAVLRLTETMADELKGHNIRVNAILPGMVDTPANRASMPNADFNRWVKPESIANVIGFLASDISKDITGALIPVYGLA
jgi:NAD(P)-dependent dehydrogenase (short-subunit alcohol dehydrogenase family)